MSQSSIPGAPSTPSQAASARSSLPTPYSIARRSSLAKGAGNSPVDSPDTAYKKQSLAEAISRNDPARYRDASATDEADGEGGSPGLISGRLPRPGLVGRRSVAGLKPRSETPTGLPTPPSSQLSPSSLAHVRASSAASSVEGTSLLPSPGKRKQNSPGNAIEAARSKSPLIPIGRQSLGGAGAGHSLRGYSTPKRLSDVHSRASSAASNTPSLPSHAAATIASRAREQSFVTTRRGRDLEIGDIVTMEGSGLTGVLRHLGPVEFKQGFYAGLELTGDSVGKGKNDGSVGGVQYFACQPGNGVFCPASKVVAMSEAPPKEAVARPASALSNRSGRSSDVHERPPSTTPGRRRASTISRPPSTTPSRASSRASARPPSATPGSRPASAMSLSRPSSRLTARKSLGTVAAVRDDEDTVSERRPKTSAEFAAAAEQRITEGSRAHKLLGLTAKDLEQRQRTGVRVSSRLGGSPVKANPASPLKESLLNTRNAANGVRTPRSSLSGIQPPAFGGPSTPGLPKARQSLGGIPTPRAAKGRASMFARTNPGSNSSSTASAMPPPSRRATKEGPERPTSSLSVRSSSRLSNVMPLDDDADDIDKVPSGRNSSLDRTRVLLEEMDLTPRRPGAPSRQSRHHQSASFSGYGTNGIEDASQQAESVAEAVVPLSLYEEQVAELEKLRTQMESLEKSNADLLKQQSARKARLSEVRSQEALLEEERAKMRAEAREREREMEDEREMERDDELRRRKEVEDREKELKEKLDDSTKSLAKLADEHQKARSEHESQARGLEAKLQESENLIEEMKKSLESQSQKQEGETVQLKVKDAEIDSLKSAVQRLESEIKKERKELGAQVDELKDAGRETISLYEQRIEEVERENHDLINNMKLLEQRAQEAIASAESRYEALAATSASAGGQGSSSAGATEIDNENLREQVAHLQDKVGNLEDQNAEASIALEKEKEYSQKRKERSVEVETSLKNEIKRLKAEVDRLTRSEKELRDRFDEMHEALDESKAALESERAELEVLRADVENIESLNGGSVRSSKAKEVSDVKKKWDAEKAKLEAEVKTLRSQLDSAKHSAHDSSTDTNHSKLGVPSPGPTSPSSKEDKRASTASSIASNGTNRRSSRMSLTGAPASSEASYASSSANQMSGLSYLVRQLTDENVDIKARYKLLESEIRDRLRAAEQKARALELTVETLEQELAAARNGRGDADGPGSASSALSTRGDLASRLAECEQKLQENESELARLRVRVKEVEKDREREVGGLNKEVAELEALVEARIFHEDELEGEISRLRRKLEREREKGKSGDAGRTSGSPGSRYSLEADASHGKDQDTAPAARPRAFVQHEREEPVSPTANRRASRRLSTVLPSTTLEEPETSDASGVQGRSDDSAKAKNREAVVVADSNDDNDDDDDDDEDFCGLCSKRGHSVVDCKELDKPALQLRHFADAAPATASGGKQTDAEPCDDCGQVGHRFEECPYAHEIF